MKLKRKKRAAHLPQPLAYDEIGPIYHYDDKGRPTCGARVKIDGEWKACWNRKRLSPSGRCFIHGGGPNTGRPVKTGFWSQFMPDHLLETYEAALANPDLGSMRDSIATMDALIAQYLQGLLKMPPLETLDAATGLTYDMERCIGDEEREDELRQLIRECRTMLQSVTKSRHEEREVRQAMRERAELVRTEAMRVEKSARYLSVEQSMAMVAALATIVNKYVEAESTRTLIAQALARLVNRGTGQEDRSPGDHVRQPQGLPSPGQTEAVASGHSSILLEPDQHEG